MKACSYFLQKFFMTFSFPLELLLNKETVISYSVLNVYEFNDEFEIEFSYVLR